MFRTDPASASPSARRPAAFSAMRMAARSGGGRSATSSRYALRCRARSSRERVAGVTSTSRKSAARSSASSDERSIAFASSARTGCRAREGNAAASARPTSRSSDSTGDSRGSSAAGASATNRNLLTAAGLTSLPGMRVRAVLLTALVAALLPAGSADAAKLVRFTTHRRIANPANPKRTFNDTHRPGLPAPQALPVNVLLPDGYDGKRRFPVLYLLHGHGDTYNSWVDPKNGDLRHLAAGLPAIVVMPEGGRGWYTNWWNGGKRGDPAWERYHLDELIPLIRRKFRIRSARRWHAIAGLSMGGEGAMSYAEQRPAYFGSVASFSGVLSIQRPEWPDGFNTQGEKYEQVYGDPNAQSFYWQGHNPTTLVDNLRHTRVFVAVGDGTPNPSRPDEVQNTFGQV